MTQAASAPAPEFLEYICNACGYIYKEVDGDPDSGLAPGTRFADITDDWECPLCAVTKSDFVLYQPVDPRARQACTPARPVPRGKGVRAGVVIVGAGRAGWQMAQAIREVSADMSITLVTACSGDVYDKPLLSVAMAKSMAPEQLVRETGVQAAQRLGVNLQAQTQATRICTRTQTLHTTRGKQAYEQLVLAHGAQAVLPPSMPAELCWRINHLDAYRRLRAALDGAPKDVAIVGAGLIGSELANDLALGGHRITLLDVQAEPLARWQAEKAGQQVLQAWKDLPIRFVGNVSVTVLEKIEGRMHLRTACGKHIVADQVIAAAGLQTPNRLAQSASLEWNNGIAVDPITLRTNNANIHALGDCITVQGQASRYIEPITRQARTIAATLCGCEPVPYAVRTAVVRVKTSSLPMTLHGCNDHLFARQ